MDKNTTLKNTFQHLKKKYGAGIIMKLGEKQKSNIATLSSGSLSLNLALGIGGFPCGRIVEIYGREASGKTTVAMHAMKEAQKKGLALLVDTEHAFDKHYAEKLGIDVDNLLICQPDYGEQALDVVEHCIKSEAIDIVVIDSVSALIPEAELKGEMADQSIGGQARLMSKAMRRLTAMVHKTGVVCIFINQLRYKIGLHFGSPETTSGGNALKFYASIRLDMRNIGQIKNKEGVIIGHRARIKVVKNKLAAPFKEAIVEIVCGKGISVLGEIVDLSLSLGLLTRAGAWFSYGTVKLGQGREAVIDRLAKDETLKTQLLEKILAHAKQ